MMWETSESATATRRGSGGPCASATTRRKAWCCARAATARGARGGGEPVRATAARAGVRQRRGPAKATVGVRSATGVRHAGRASPSRRSRAAAAASFVGPGAH
eukprot:1622872-Prymnesium_polylepis.1